MLTDDLLELQRIDTATDQLRHRHGSLPERLAATAAHDELAGLQQRRTELADRATVLEAAIGSAERDGAVLSAQRSRLEGQLRTVVTPREVDALMHEIDAIRQRRDELDDRELEQLEEQADVESQLEQLAVREPSLQGLVRAADADLDSAEAVIAGEADALATARAEVVLRLDQFWLARYDELRKRFAGVAISRLAGTRCDGCHLDLSVAELDRVRHESSGAPTECPQCGRLLVAG